ncbi:MAG TPA: hypothetical protein VGP07_18655 [Polyangia bacterium]|jgi:outer membrane protein W
MTKTLSLLAVSATTLLLARPGFAQTGEPQGGAIEVGLRTGYGIPLGHTGRTANDTTDDKLSGSIKGEIPLWLDLGYRIDPQIYVGLSFQYAFGLIPSGVCDAGVSCSVSDLRLDANFIYHLAARQSVDPWLGIGVGYEWLSLKASAQGQESNGTAGAFEFANLQAGADFEVAPGFALGPFVSFSLGEYQSISFSGVTSGSMDVVSKSLHEWLLFGVRGAFDFRI